MKRILHYVGKMDVGGMESLLMSLYRNLNRDEYQFDFAVHSNDRGCYEDEIEALGGKVFRFPPMRSNPARYYRTWSNFFAENEGYFHAFSMHTNSLANPLAMIAALHYKDMKCIIHSHSAYADKGKYQVINDLIHKINRYFLNKSRIKKVACSQEAAIWLFGEKAVNDGEVEILYNGVDYNIFYFSEEKRQHLRKELGIEDNPVICQIGHLLPVKNFEFTIDLMTLLTKKISDIKLLIVGDGTLRPKLEERVRAFGLDDSVAFLGVRGDIPSILSASDVFVLPSHYEGLPVSTVEAQASGIHCVISSNVSRMTKISNLIEYVDITDKNAWERVILEKLSKAESTIQTRTQVMLNPEFDIRNSVKKYIQIIQ